MDSTTVTVVGDIHGQLSEFTEDLAHRRSFHCSKDFPSFQVTKNNRKISGCGTRIIFPARRPEKRRK